MVPALSDFAPRSAPFTIPFTIALTFGDPAGIGPEVVAKALTDQTLRNWLRMQPWPVRFVVVGDRVGGWDDLADTDLAIVWQDLATNVTVCPGIGNAQTGEASFQYLQAAIAGALRGDYGAIVTAPIAKHGWQAAGHTYPGQTEVLAARTQSDRPGMLFAARSPHSGWVLRVLLATVHIPLSQVPLVLTPALLTTKLDTLRDSLRRDFGLAGGTLAVAGLNPHAGEGGYLGTEEETWLKPTLAVWQAANPDWRVWGPVPPDALWVGAARAWYHGGEAPIAYLALYHDQGLIPVKMLAFDRAVNVTVGLPFVRTSPDHGTAFDIAGQGIADPSSMIAAIQWAIELTAQRRGAGSRTNL
ncbi:MAG: 4-hydroxythreonine-4-phosphate dehydrogenase PdxA [Oscillatoriales cyanobacterium SM2_1_8]|nr:4-hydroxythreonine-4-phosphate dehydrogenase PdxA [Oscillatoriales cyanobacterium SM2_1_8]